MRLLNRKYFLIYTLCLLIFSCAEKDMIEEYNKQQDKVNRAESRFEKLYEELDTERKN